MSHNSILAQILTTLLVLHGIVLTAPPFAVPAAPQYLFCKQPTDTTVKCSVKTPDTDATSIVVETKIGWAGTYTTAVTVTTNLTAPFQTFDLSGLTPQTVYYIRVKAVNGDGSSAYALEKFVVTRPPATPIAPSALDCTALNFNFVQCVWADNSWNEYEFRLERKTGAGSFSQIAVVGPNKTFYNDNSVAASTSYTYRIRAYWKSIIDSFTVGTLPSAGSSETRVVFVTNGVSGTDCTTGGGSTLVKCYSNGSAWVHYTLSGAATNEEFSSYSSEDAVTTGSDTTNTETDLYSSLGAASATGSEGTLDLGIRVLTNSTKPVEITKLCRYKASGNDEAHDLFLRTYGTVGPGTTLASVTLTSGEVSGASVGMQCKAVTAKVTLAPNTQYIVGGSESATDNHFSLGNDIGGYGANSAATQDVLSFNTGQDRWVDSTIGANHSFGHSFQYDLVSAPQASNPPTNLRIGTIYPDKIQILWDSEATDATGYEVDRCQGAACSSWSTVESPTAKEHTSTSLSANTLYRYRVRSTISGTTDSANSSTLDVTTKTSNNFYVNTGGQLTTVLAAVAAGGVIEAQAGATFTAPSAGLALSADGTAGSRITFRTTNHASLPTKRAEPSVADQMFTVYVGSDTGVNLTGDFWTITGMRITSTDVQGAASAIDVKGVGNIVEKGYLHPYHHNSYYWFRNIFVAVSLNEGSVANPNIVRHNYIYGFYGEEAGGGASATECVKSNELDGGIVYDNHCTAGFVQYFGGGEGSDAVAGFQATVTEQGTGPSSTVTSFKTNNITNLKVGMVISVGQGSGGWGTGDQFGASARVAAINTSTNLITLDTALVRDPQNDPPDPGGVPGTANVSDVVRWRSTRASNIQFYANTFFTDPWNIDDNLSHGHGTKGFFEVKDTKGLVLVGNRFDGFDQALTLTSGNQNGNNVSHNVEDVMVRSNVFETYAAMAGIVLRDPYKRSYGPSNWVFDNNLLYVGSRNRITEIPGALTAANSPGNAAEREAHYGLKWTHNTFMWALSSEYPGIQAGVEAMKVVNEADPDLESIYGFELRDNIFAHWSNGLRCTNSTNIECLRGNDEDGPPTVLNNLVANPNGATTQSFTDDYTTNGYLTPIPTTKATLGMYDTDDYTPHGFALDPATSAYEGLGTAGSDPGANIDTLLAALEMDMPSDIAPPTVSISEPVGGQVLTPLTGSVTFTASVSDASGIASVELVVDQTRICLDTSAPFSCSITTSAFADGLHTLRAIALDNAGLPYTATYEFVEFDNNVSPPTAPSSLNAATISSSQVDLSWTDNSGDETAFKLERCSGSGCTGFVEFTTVGSGVAAHSNTGLAASTLYRYRVRATNGAGDSTYSNIAEATTSAGASFTICRWSTAPRCITP